MITIKEGDVHEIKWTISLDLSGCSVFIKATRANGKVPAVILPAYVIDGPKGIVGHRLDGTLPAGSYECLFKIGRNNDKVTAPSDGSERLQVQSG